MRLTQEAGASVSALATSSVHALEKRLEELPGIPQAEAGALLELASQSVLPPDAKATAARLIASAVVEKGDAAVDLPGTKMQRHIFSRSI